MKDFKERLLRIERTELADLEVVAELMLRVCVVIFIVATFLIVSYAITDGFSLLPPEPTWWVEFRLTLFGMILGK